MNKLIETKKPWKDYCLYCTKDLVSGSQFKLYCNSICREKCSKINMQKLEQEFSWINIMLEREIIKDRELKKELDINN